MSFFISSAIVGPPMNILKILSYFFLLCLSFLTTTVWSVVVVDISAHHVNDQLNVIEPFIVNNETAIWSRRSIYRGIECFNPETSALWKTNATCLSGTILPSAFSSFSPTTDLVISAGFTIFPNNNGKVLFAMYDPAKCSPTSPTTCFMAAPVGIRQVADNRIEIIVRLLSYDGMYGNWIYPVAGIYNATTNSTFMNLRFGLQFDSTRMLHQITTEVEGQPSQMSFGRSVDWAKPATELVMTFGGYNPVSAANFILHHFHVSDVPLSFPVMELRPPTLFPVTINLENLFGTSIHMPDYYEHPIPLTLQIVGVSTDFFQCVQIFWNTVDGEVRLEDQLSASTGMPVDIPHDISANGIKTLFPCQTTDVFFTYRARLTVDDTIYSDQNFTIYTANFVIPVVKESVSVVATTGYVQLSLEQEAADISLPITTITLTSLPQNGSLFYVVDGAYHRISTAPIDFSVDTALCYQYSHSNRVSGQFPSLLTFPWSDAFSFTLTNSGGASSAVGSHSVSVLSPLPAPIDSNIVGRQATRTKFLLPLTPSELSASRVGYVVTQLPSFGTLYDNDAPVSTVPHVFSTLELTYQSNSGVWANPGFAADSLKYYLYGTDLIVTSPAEYSLGLEVYRINQLPQLSLELKQQMRIGETTSLAMSISDPDWELPSCNSTYLVTFASNTNRLQLDASALINSSSKLLQLPNPPTQAAKVIVATSSMVSFETYGEDLKIYMNSIKMTGVAAASATLSISVVDTDSLAWNDKSQDGKPLATTKEVTMSVAAEKKSTNSVFLDSALMMAIIIGVPCLLVVIAVVLCVRKRCKSIDKKKLEREKRREEIEKEIATLQQHIKEQSFKASQSFQSLEGLAFGLSPDGATSLSSANDMISMLAHRQRTLQGILQQEERCVDSPDLELPGVSSSGHIDEHSIEASCEKADVEVVVYPPLAT